MKQRFYSRLVLTVLLALVVGGCEGPIGPVGPQGQQGPQGIPGDQGPPGLPGVPATIRWDMVTLDADGDGQVLFSNAQVETSVITCYMSNSSTGPWLVVALDVSFGIGCGASNIGPDLGVALVGGIPLWFFLVTMAEGG